MEGARERAEGCLPGSSTLMGYMAGMSSHIIYSDSMPSSFSCDFATVRKPKMMHPRRWLHRSFDKSRHQALGLVHPAEEM